MIISTKRVGGQKRAAGTRMWTWANRVAGARCQWQRGRGLLPVTIDRGRRGEGVGGDFTPVGGRFNVLIYFFNKCYSVVSRIMPFRVWLN